MSHKYKKPIKHSRLRDVTPKLSRKEKRAIRIKESNPRESYRNYSPKSYPYFLIILIDAFYTFFALCIFLLLLTFPALGIYSFARWSDLLTKTVAALIIIFIFARILFRASIKRILFITKLKRICKKYGFRLYIHQNSMRSVLFPHNEVAFSVEVSEKLYEVMFFPAWRKMITFSFESERRVKIISGLTDNNLFKFKSSVFGIKAKTRIKEYGFETSSKAIKVLLLNPAPLEFYYFDRRELKIVPGGTGANFFGYSAYTGNGFISELLRNHKS